MTKFACKDCDWWTNLSKIGVGRCHWGRHYVETMDSYWCRHHSEHPANKDWVKLADVQPAMEKAEEAYKQIIHDLEADVKQVQAANDRYFEDHNKMVIRIAGLERELRIQRERR